VQSRGTLATSAGPIFNRIQGQRDSVGGCILGERQHPVLRDAGAVRDYLISQGVLLNLTAAGLGSTNPTATNATAGGRERNRRVEMLIPGDLIGITVASAAE
jgi:hypothetical protein